VRLLLSRLAVPNRSLTRDGRNGKEVIFAFRLVDLSYKFVALARLRLTGSEREREREREREGERTLLVGEAVVSLGGIREFCPISNLAEPGDVIFTRGATTECLLR